MEHTASVARRVHALVAMLAVAATAGVNAADKPWPQFRGPDANPVGTNARLVDAWSKTDNIEWTVDIPGLGWSSPIVVGDRVFVTSVTTDGPSKPPQIGTEYSNEYVAELTKQGLTEAQVLEKVNARDMEMPHEVQLHYVLYCLSLKNGKVQWTQDTTRVARRAAGTARTASRPRRP